ncbi:hypothetical protein CWC05_08015 [Pseudoalteromonas ruthenica]|uniref:diguanylate cyclase n=1 Tax=Pseudoalteromonas ruthenica TaxID=151081 RepID=A0A5S3Z7C0_9GAMM|nr:diguanylate cyclase [Pseudoalteromonas ruthenica]TMP87436.1 hypothetical protein CWC05_08015 [Pseudoalteromonas ruthenica]
MRVLAWAMMLLWSCSALASSMSINTEADSLATAQNSPHWQPLNKPFINLGNKVRYGWLRVNLSSHQHPPSVYIIAIDNPLIDSLKAFHLRDNKLINTRTIGSQVDSADRLFKDESLSFYIDTRSPGEHWVYIEVIASDGFRMPVQVHTLKSYFEYKSSFNSLFGAVMGLAATLILTTLFFFILSRQARFLLATAYISALALIGIYVFGYGYRYLHPDTPWLQTAVLPILLMAAPSLLVALNQTLIAPVKRKTAITVMLITVAIALLPNLLPAAIADPIVVVASTLFCLFGTAYSAWQGYRKQQQQLWVLSIANLMLLALMGYFCLNYFGFALPINKTSWWLFLPPASSALLVCFVVIRNLLSQHSERMHAQQQALAEQQTRDQLLAQQLALEEQTKEELENKVEERTIELQITLRELEEKNTELERINNEDPLTGVKNRRFFDKRLEHELRRSQRDDAPLSLLMIDIDHFKKVNDSYGHPAGDAAIKLVSHTIKACLRRPFDHVCRYGGEEFAVILPNTTHEGALKLGEEVCTEVGQQQVEFSEHQFSLTVSIGVHTAYGETTAHAGDITHMADEALYHAKAHGRNQVISSQSLP